MVEGTEETAGQGKEVKMTCGHKPCMLNPECKGCDHHCGGKRIEEL
jgi:hypothetical protein